MRIRVLPYKQGSKSARVLADALGGKVLRLRDSRFRPRSGDLIINWGSSTDLPLLSGFPKINSPEKIGGVSNKLAFFQKMYVHDPDIIPTFWTSVNDIPADAYPVVCRTVLTGHSGAGIVIAHNEDELVPAPLYVQYIKKKHEFRVHVGSANKIIAVQRKARRRETPDSEVNWMVRNHQNGFVFVRNGFETPEAVLTAAKRTIRRSGLDFGAVDVVYHERDDRAYVLEINSAPGIEGQTIQDYVNYFTRGEDNDNDEG